MIQEVGGLYFPCSENTYCAVDLRLCLKICIHLRLGRRTGLMVRASDSGSGDPGSILGRVGVCFLEQETFPPQKYW